MSAATTNGARAMQRRRRRPVDNDWLALVEPVGQFLTTPVLRSTFPQGFPAVPADLRLETREHLAALAETSHTTADSHAMVAPNAAARDTWIDWLLRVVLGWGEHYRTGDEATAITHEVAEYRTTLRADGILRDTSGALRALLVSVPFGTRFDARLPGEEWSASPLERVGDLARAHNVRIALLTDGDRIAVINVPIGRKDQPAEGTGGHAVWQTTLFAEGAERDYFAAFVALLHAQRFFNATKRETLEALFERSALTQQDLTKTLGLQVRKAVELMVGAFSRSDRERRGELLDALPPHTVYEAAATVMMRLVFMLYAEEHDLLPIGDITYAENYAVSTLRDQLEADAVRLGDEPLERRATAWRRLLAAFNAIYAGIDHDRLRLPAYGGRLFDPTRFPFLDRCRVDDLTTRAILTSLQTVTLGGESRRLSFLTLDVEQIGHIYEGLLDHDALRVADVHLGFDGKSGAESEIALAELERTAAQGRAKLITFLAEKLGRTEKAIDKGLARGEKLVAGEEPETRRLVITACESDEQLVRRVSPYAALLRDDLQGLPTFYPAGGIVVTKTRARRDSGTEYTPRVLAEEIVRYALEPLVYSPGPVDGAHRDTWQVRPSSQLLALKICDPACGSGAFLVAVCRYLAERVAEAWQREARIPDDNPIRDAQRLIAERCLYGVDRDPMAVEMGKLSLWLLTFSRHRPFSFLDHTIREGDSLLGITSLDQLRALHFDPERGRKLHDGALFDVLRPLGDLIDEAARYRLQLEEHATRDIQDAQEKARLESLARNRTEAARLIADALSAIALSNATRNTDSAFAGLGDVLQEAIAAGTARSVTVSALAEATRPTRLKMDSDKPPDAPARRPLHWPLEFPEVFARERGGFELVVGNPPFLGGKLITGHFGTDYRTFLVQQLAYGKRGHADLVAYFFLRAARIAKRFGFIATNTIGQGDTREVALDALLDAFWAISRAEKSRVWPGTAAIQVAEVWCRHGQTAEPSILSGSLVPGISSLLLPASRTVGNPFRLKASTNIAFQGSVVLGLGFTMTAERARDLIAGDARNRDILFPFINGEDICTRSDVSPSRWIINFHDWDIQRASMYRECFAQVTELVKPQRQLSKREQYRTMWWRFAERCANLYVAIGAKTFVTAMPQTSKFLMPIRIPGDYVYSQTLVVFSSESKELYGVLSSEIHRAWSRTRGSTLETRARYTPTDCFETFALPNAPAGPVDTIMRTLHDHRAAVMLGSEQGSTAVYNRVHSPDERTGKVLALRDLHRKLDLAVIAAYGWQDVDLDHDFRKTDEGLRFTISDAARVEILDRLLELNHERHAAEVASGAWDVPRRKNGSTRGGKNAEGLAPPVFELQ